MEKKKDISHFDLLDWNFTREDSRLYLHNFCWYPSRFIPIIPAHLIQALSKTNETVLDPFCGIGTTLVEALKQRRNAIGVDLNPIACFVSKTKGKILTGHKVNLSLIEGLLENLAPLSGDDLFTKKRTGRGHYNLREKSIPNYAVNVEWFHPETLKMLSHIYYSVEDLPRGLTRDICKIFFISILMQSSGHDLNKPYTYYADNVKPKKEKLIKDAYKLYVQKLDKFLCEYKLIELPEKNRLDFAVYNEDARGLEGLVDKKVDLIVTSPPYLNVTDYTTGFRLAHLWYSFQKDMRIEDIKRREIGARYRRKSRNSLNEYVGDMQSVLCKMDSVLKTNGYLCLILGESQKYSKIVNKIIMDFMSNELRLEYIDSFSREIIKKFFIHPNGGGVSTEEIIIYRKKRK